LQDNSLTALIPDPQTPLPAAVGPLESNAMSDFRIGIGQIWHESNTFACLSTDIENFTSYHDGIRVGQEILDAPEHRDELTGFKDVFGRAGVEMRPLIAAGALPSGPWTQAAVDHIEDILRRQVRKAGPIDGICFALHGAMSARAIPDLDGYFLGVLREEVGADVPIVCPLDCHAVVTRKMVELATALIAYRTHPHVDEAETGARAANILLDTLRGRIKPTVGYQKVPLLLPPPDAGTHEGALKELFDSFIAWDQMDGVVAGSLCGCYAWQDVPEQGVAALAVTNDDQPLADRLARQLAEQAWEARFRLLPEPMMGPQAAVRAAAAVDGCPVIITDSADTVGGGAGGDTTTLLSALLEMRHEVDGLILISLPDPQAVRAAKAAGPGGTVSVEVGGKRDTRFSRPVPVTGQVLCVTEGPIHDDGHFGSTPMVEVGAIVCLGVDNVRLVLTERVIVGPQPSLYRKVGINPFGAKLVALKTGVGFKATYGQVAKAVIRADCPGSVSYNFRHFNFEHIPRPMFPLDPDAEWEPTGP
jgi:microcystin degradation protein MlrC